MGRVRVLVGVTALLVGGIGLLHLPAARPLLQAVGGCPVGRELEPVARDAARDAALAPVLAGDPAPAHPAFGFELGRSPRAEVDGWAAANGVTCEGLPGAARCGPVPAGALLGMGSVDAVHFQFDARDTLVGVSTSRAARGPDAALLVVRDGAEGLAVALGDAPRLRGEDDPAWLAAGALNQVAREFRYADYRARVEATHLGQGRFLVRGIAQVVSGG